MAQAGTEIIIGIDPSINHTAICVITDGTVSHEWLIEPDRGLVTPARLLALCNGLIGAFDQLAHPPALVAMESEIWTSSPAQGSQQAMAQAALQMVIWGRLQNSWLGKTRFLSVNPSHVKKYAGAPKKQHMLLQVYKKWRREYKDDNAADAFVIAVIAHDLLAYAPTMGVAKGRHFAGKGLWAEVTKPQVEVLDKLAKTGFVWEKTPPVQPSAPKVRRTAYLGPMAMGVSTGVNE